MALLPLIVFSYQHYSIDTYGILYDGTQTHLNAFFGSLRYFGAVIYWMVDCIGHNPIIDPTMDIVLYILIVSLAVTFFVLYIYKLLNNKSVWSIIIVEFSVLITIVNVWFTDILTFPECITLTAIGVCLCFSSIICFFESKKLYQYFISSVIFILALAIYQQFVSIYVIYTILILSLKLINKKECTAKDCLISCVIPSAFIVINSILYYVIGKVIVGITGVQPNERIALTISSILENVLYFVSHQHSFLKGRGFFSTEVLTLSYILIVSIWIVSLIFNYKNNKKLFFVFFVSGLFIFAYIGAYLPGLVSTSHGTRTMFALFSVFALFSIGAIALWDNRVTKVVLCCVLVLVFALNIYKTVDMAIEQIVTNTNEIEYANSVAYEISKYESKSGKAVNQIAVSYDENANFDSQAVYTRYAIEPLLELQLERKVNYIDTPDEVYNEYFEGKDWQNFDCQEQLQFKNDTLYLCVY